MSVKSSQVAYGVRVKLNDNFEEKCLGDRYLKDEKVLFIRDPKPYKDIKGEYVWVTGGSLINSGYVYLDQIDLEFPIPETPLYQLYGDEKSLNEISLEEKVLDLIEIAEGFMYPQYYSHTKNVMWKIDNSFTNYEQDTVVLCGIDEGFEKALDMAIKEITLRKNEFYNKTKDIV